MSYDETDKEALKSAGEVFKPVMEKMKEQMEQGNKPKELTKTIVQTAESKIIVPPGGHTGLVGLDGKPLRDEEKARQKAEMAALKAMLGGGDLKIAGYTDNGDPIYKLSPEQAKKYKAIQKHQQRIKRNKAQSKVKRKWTEGDSTLSTSERKKRSDKNKSAKASRKRNRRKK